MSHRPPYRITPAILSLVEQIGEALGRIQVADPMAGKPHLHRINLIHPFQDGNGRMGRLWQTLILACWRPVFSTLPVESLIRDHRGDYYAALNACNQAGESTRFIELILTMIHQSMLEVANTEQEDGQVTEQVKQLLRALQADCCSARELMARLRLHHRPHFFYSYLRPALEQGLVEMTRPDTPRARNQQYRLTSSGRRQWRRMTARNMDTSSSLD